MFYSVPQPHKYISGYETSNDIGFIFVSRAENILVFVLFVLNRIYPQKNELFFPRIKDKLLPRKKYCD